MASGDNLSRREAPECEAVHSELDSGGSVPLELTDFLNRIKEQSKDAIEVLMNVCKKSKKKVLFPEVDHMLNVMCVYKKPDISSIGYRSKRIILPHPIHERGNTTICLIMRDLDRSEKARIDPDVDKQARQWAQKLELEYGVTEKHVQKILTKRQMEREYATYNDKRKLASAYDIFLVDHVVERSVFRICGKEFHKAKKMPLRLFLDKSLTKQIELAYSVVSLPLSPYRTRVSLRVGNLGISPVHLLENIQAAVTSIVKYGPGGLLNIRSFNLQMISGGPSLPLYVDIGPRNAVTLKKQQSRNKSVADEEIIDELTTLPDGLEVSVKNDGRVDVLDSLTKKPVRYRTINDEWEPEDDSRSQVDLKKLAIKNDTRRKLKRKKMKSITPNEIPHPFDIGNRKKKLRTVEKTFLEGMERKKIRNKSDAVLEVKKRRKDTNGIVKFASKRRKFRKKDAKNQRKRIHAQ